jgi:hypothetical protein
VKRLSGLHLIPDHFLSNKVSPPLVTALDCQYQTGKTTEHSYHPALSLQLSAMLPALKVVNEPKRQSCGAPDYVLSKRKTLTIPTLAGKQKQRAV